MKCDVLYGVQKLYCIQAWIGRKMSPWPSLRASIPRATSPPRSGRRWRAARRGAGCGLCWAGVIAAVHYFGPAGLLGLAVTTPIIGGRQLGLGILQHDA